MRPIEAIDSIKIFQVDGLNGVGGGQGLVADGGGSLPDQVVSSALRYQVAKPLVDAIMKDAGLGGAGLTGVAENLAQMAARPKPPMPANGSGEEV